MLPPILDYLFIAHFTDGSVIHQTRYDVSTIEPLTRSAFYDVVQRLPEVESFTLTNGPRSHTVYLKDGHFNSDGKILINPHGELTNFRLIYFRRVQVSSYSADELEHVIIDDRRRPTVKLFVMGWQANDARGKNFQMVLEIDPVRGLVGG
jgi:hypothetical protein